MEISDKMLLFISFILGVLAGMVIFCGIIPAVLEFIFTLLLGILVGILACKVKDEIDWKRYGR